MSGLFYPGVGLEEKSLVTSRRRGGGVLKVFL
jgi:hypothetical protein